MKKIILVAIVLRVLVAIFYFHPDIKTYFFQTSFLKRGILNVYDYLISNRQVLPLKEEFVYFPLTHLALGSYQTLLDPLIGSKLDAWLFDAEASSIVKNPDIFLFLFLLKLPYLIVDLLIARLLLKISIKAAILWLLNPFTIVIFYIFSNIDIMPILFTLISFLIAREKKYVQASFFLGVGAAFKAYPLLLVPFLFIKAKGAKEKVATLVVPMLTFLFIILPFWSDSFVRSALVSGLTTRIINLPFLIIYSVIFLYAAFIKKSININSLWISTFLTIYSFAHFHIQWLAWTAPFLIILVVNNPKFNRLVFVLILLSFSIPILYQDRAMSWGLLRVYSSYYDLLPTPYTIVQKIINPEIVQRILQMAFALTSAILITNIIKLQKTNE